MVYKKLE